MKAWVDRKLFIHNLGHASLAYLAYIKNPRWKYTFEALNDPELYRAVFKTMQEAAYILLHMHADEFTRMDLTNHINDLLRRFSNRSLKDTIFRVGCDLERKLGPEDRLIPVIKYGYKNELPVKNIMKVLVAAIYFDARDENNEHHPADQKFLQKFNRNLSKILVHHCKFDPSRENDLIFLAMNLDDQLKLNL
jgi:mannitol-1-phosphate 5-dehydrogenase